MKNFILEDSTLIPHDFSQFLVEIVGDRDFVRINKENLGESHLYILDYIEEALLHFIMDYETKYKVVSSERSFYSNVEKMRFIQSRLRMSGPVEIFRLKEEDALELKPQPGTSNVLGFLLFLNNCRGEVTFQDLEEKIETKISKFILYPHSFTHRGEIFSAEGPMFVLKGTIEKFLGNIWAEF